MKMTEAIIKAYALGAQRDEARIAALEAALAAPAPEPVAYRWKGMSGSWFYGEMPSDLEPGDEPLYAAPPNTAALQARIAALEAALHQIALPWPDREIRYAGMLSQNIARAALGE